MSISLEKLCLAINKKDLNAVKIALPAVNDINATYQKLSPLMYAVQTGDLSLVDLILENGADPNLKNKKGKSAFSIAIKNKNYQLALNLIENGAMPHGINQLSVLIFNRFLEYPEYDGICNGLSRMAESAILAEDIDHFNDRYKKIFYFVLTAICNIEERCKLANIPTLYEKYPNPEFDKIVLEEMKKIDFNLVTSKLDTQQSLAENIAGDHEFGIAGKNLTLQPKISTENYFILEVLPFFYGVNLHQASDDIVNKIFHDNNITYHRHNYLASNVISPLDLVEKDGIAVVDFYSGVYEEKALEECLGLLDEMIKQHQIDFPIAMQISGNGHTLTIGYDPQKNWVYFESNAAPFEINQDYVTLAEKVKNAFIFPTTKSPALILTTTISTSGNHASTLEKYLSALHLDSRWKDLHAVTMHKINLKNDQGFNWEDLAIFKGDTKTIEQINLHHYFKRHPNHFLFFVIMGMAIGLGLASQNTRLMMSFSALMSAAITLGMAHIISKVSDGNNFKNAKVNHFNQNDILPKINLEQNPKQPEKNGLFQRNLNNDSTQTNQTRKPVNDHTLPTVQFKTSSRKKNG